MAGSLGLGGVRCACHYGQAISNSTVGNPAVFAIQDVEAEAFKTRTKANVEVLGHLVDADFLPENPITPGKPLKIGFIGSSNMVNVRTFELLANALTAHPELLESHKFYAAGSISNQDFARSSSFICMGFVDDPKDFYRDMDIILNPNIGGSGLKIKSVEALAYGKPLIATYDAMIGIPTNEYYHSFKTMDDFCNGLKNLTNDISLVPKLAEAGQNIFLDYQNTQKQTLTRYFPSPITAHSDMGQISHRASDTPIASKTFEKQQTTTINSVATENNNTPGNGHQSGSAVSSIDNVQKPATTKGVPPA